MMRLRLLLIMLALTVPLSAADVSGIWNMNLKADWTTIPALVCTFSPKRSTAHRQLQGTRGFQWGRGRTD